jgi:hypothetical protein
LYRVDTPLGEDSNDEVRGASHGDGRLDRGHNFPPEYPGTLTDFDAADQASALRRPGEPSIRMVPFSPNREFVSQRVTQPGARDSWSAPWRRSGTLVRGMPAAYVASEMSGPALGRSDGLPTDLPIGGFHFMPDISKGLGFSATHTAPGIRFTTFAKLTLDNPNFTFRLDITRGHLKTAEVELSGLAAVRVGFDGGTNADFKNPNQAFELPLDTSFPIPGIPVPFAATFHQSILVQTMFTAKNATLNAVGKYGFGGTITAGVIDGHLGATAPVFIDTKQNLAESLNGASLGVNGLVLGYGGKFLVGLGAYSFAVGPYLSVNTTVGATRGSDAKDPSPDTRAVPHNTPWRWTMVSAERLSGFVSCQAHYRDSWDEPGDHPDQNGLADGALGVRGKNHVREQVP